MLTKHNQAHTFFETHVEPNLSAWSAQPIDIRLAMNAVVSLYHMADHFWHAYGSVDPIRVFGTSSAADFRKELAVKNNHFAVLRDVAEAHKHMYLDRRTRVLTNSTQTAVGATGFGEAGFDTGPYGGGTSIVVKLDDNSRHHLSYLTEKVRSLWITMLA
jgi:hypothetical protein